MALNVAQILKLDELKNTDQDMVWRKESLETGDPKCLCSACGQLIKDVFEFDDPDGDQAGDHFPIRLWRGKGKSMEEAVLHTSCFMYLHHKFNL